MSQPVRRTRSPLHGASLVQIETIRRKLLFSLRESTLSMKHLTRLILCIAPFATTPLWAAEKEQISAPAFEKDIARQMVQHSIQKFEIAEDVSVEDAIDSMQLRANMRNFKMVADLPLSEQVKAMGQDANYMRILAFCDALIAKKMVCDGFN